MRCRGVFLVGVVFMVGCRIQGQPPTGYYGSAAGQTGPALKSALHDIIVGQTVVPYSSTAFDTHDGLEILDQDPADTNDVILLYSQRSEPKATWPDWNREHVWPNSYGIDDQLPAYSDLHNLRAADQNVNSARGNKLYDWSDTNAPSYTLPAHPEAPLCSTDSDSWEPPDAVKGDIARTLFYMAVRYEGDSSEPDLELVEDTAQINSATNLMGKLTTLVKWNRLDPVDEREEARNDAVYALQGNRNPFIDHPEWVEQVFLPHLAIEVADTGLRLRWPAGFNATLESLNVIPEVWETVTNTPTMDERGWFVNVNGNAETRLFRLRF